VTWDLEPVTCYLRPAELLTSEDVTPDPSSLGQLREKGRGEGFGQGRRVMSVVAKEYGYKGQEIAGYLWRDPSVITRYLKEGSKLASEVENVYAILQQDSNKQV
jgi:hypothetical protein